MYSYVVYYNIEKSGFNAVSAYLLLYAVCYSCDYNDLLPLVVCRTWFDCYENWTQNVILKKKPK